MTNWIEGLVLDYKSLVITLDGWHHLQWKCLLFVLDVIDVAQSSPL